MSHGAAHPKWGVVNIVEEGVREHGGNEIIPRIGFYLGRGPHRTGHRAGSSDGGIHEAGRRLIRIRGIEGTGKDITRRERR